jgi:hypothetical protein
MRARMARMRFIEAGT